MIPELEDAQKNASYQQINYIFNKIKSVKWTIIACTACIVLTYLATSYYMYSHGSQVLWNGDSVIGLREQIEHLKNSCESSKKLNEAQLKILALESENEQLVNQAHNDIFLHLRNVNQMTLEERASLRNCYMEWEQLRAASEAKESKIMFEQIIRELPDKKRAQWEHFQAQLKEDKEGTIQFIKKEHEEEQLLLKNKDKTATKNSHETTGS